MEFYLPGQALDHGAELKLLQVELLHRYDLYRSTAAFAQRGSMLYLIDPGRDASLLQVLNYLRPGVLHGHTHILAGDFGHLTVHAVRDDFILLDFPDLHDVVMVTIAAALTL